MNCVIKYVIDLELIGSFLLVPRFPTSIQLTHLITEIFLKVELNYHNHIFLTLSRQWRKGGRIPIGPIAHKGPRAGVVYFRLFNYTQHTAGFTENNWGPAPPKAASVWRDLN